MASKILSLTETLRTASASASSFDKKLSVQRQGSSFEQAAEIKLTEGQKTYQKSSEKAARTLSDATSYVSVAQYAVDEVSNLIGKAKSIAQSIATEVDPRKRDALAEEASSLISRVDELRSEATFNDQPVVNNGAASFELSLEPSVQNSDNTFLLKVAEVKLSAADLGISGLDTQDFADVRDPEGDVVTTLKAAEEQIATARASLDSAEQKIKDTARGYGLEAERRLDGSKSQLDQQADELASKIKSSLETSLATSEPAKLEPAKVQELLGAEDPEAEQLKEDRKKREEEEQLIGGSLYIG